MFAPVTTFAKVESSNETLLYLLCQIFNLNSIFTDRSQSFAQHHP